MALWIRVPELGRVQGILTRAAQVRLQYKPGAHEGSRTAALRLKYVLGEIPVTAPKFLDYLVVLGWHWA